MNKNKIIIALIIVMSTLAAVGIGLTVYLNLNREREDNFIEIDIEDGKSKIVKFEDLSLKPGEHSEYVISFVGDLNGKREIILSFSEKEKQTLEKYVYVKIEVDGELACDKLLEELLAGDAIVLSAEPIGEGFDIKITYYMPETVDNKAKNAEAEFDLTVTVSNSEAVNE